MVDTLTKEERSARMSLVKNKDTGPELKVRRLLHKLGYRFRLHRKDLPGKPDIVFPSRHKVIFVHGCFWHQHPAPNCPLARLPKSNLEFWKAKLEGNRERDVRNKQKLKKMGWSVLEVWECEVKDLDVLQIKLEGFLD